MMCCGLYATQMQRVAQRFIGIGFCMLSISTILRSTPNGIRPWKSISGSGLCSTVIRLNYPAEKMKSPSDFQEYLEKIFNKISPIDNLAVESRNPRYLNSGFFDFLERHQVIPVLLQG